MAGPSGNGHVDLHSHALPTHHSQHHHHHHHSRTFSSVSSGAGSDNGRTPALHSSMHGPGSLRPSDNSSQVQGSRQQMPLIHPNNSGPPASATNKTASSQGQPHVTKESTTGAAATGRMPAPIAPNMPTKTSIPGTRPDHPAAGSTQPNPPPTAAGTTGVQGSGVQGDRPPQGLTLDAVKREVRHADGKLERFLVSGKR
jgi:hypothetical protein